MSFFKKPIAIILPGSATDQWKEMYGPSYEAKGNRAKSLADAFDDEEEDDDDEGDDEEPEEFPDEEDLEEEL